MSACARSLKNFRKDDSFFFLIVAQMVGWKLKQLDVEGDEPT
jgi:hypothetical protein